MALPKALNNMPVNLEEGAFRGAPARFDLRVLDSRGHAANSAVNDCAGRTFAAGLKYCLGWRKERHRS